MGSVDSNGRARVAIDAPRSNVFNVDPDNVVIVGLDNSVGAAHEGGLLFDPRVGLPVSQAMVDSIVDFGVLEPVLVRKAEDEIEVIDGRQRVRACREANKLRRKKGLEPHRVPVVVKRGDDPTLFAMGIMANELRQDDPPMVKAAKAERYIGFGRTEKDAAVAFGVDVQTIRSWRSLLTLPARIQKAVEAGRLGATAAAKLATVGDADKQLIMFDDLMASGKAAPTVAETAHRVAVAKKGREPSEDDSSPPQARRALRKLVEAQAKGTIDLDQGFIDALRWVLGEVSSRKINGLGPALRLLKLED